jgi:hypothetical protein
MTWEELFDRTDDIETTVEEISRVLGDHRDDA